MRGKFVFYFNPEWLEWQKNLLWLMIKLFSFPILRWIYERTEEWRKLTKTIFIFDATCIATKTIRGKIWIGKVENLPLWINPNVRSKTSVYAKATDLKLFVKAEWKLLALAFPGRLKLFLFFISIIFCLKLFCRNQRK